MSAVPTLAHSVNGAALLPEFVELFAGGNALAFEPGIERLEVPLLNLDALWSEVAIFVKKRCIDGYRDPVVVGCPCDL